MSPLAFVIAEPDHPVGRLGHRSGSLGLSILIGYAILVGNRVLGLNPHKPTLDWRAASWLIPYLIGMGLITVLQLDSGRRATTP